ncbi:hypothetical protein QBC44DRAFT_311290 [Cladorrhinum sp. PSN332]|nr:hypothetical protein QBC44DRAFT_311290 [Cladorrhinum sp. PSN332]
MHRWYSTFGSRDTLHHQRQVILRNSETAEGGLLAFCQFAVLCIGGFFAATGFSSQVSTAVGSEVLLDGTNCALLAPYMVPYGHEWLAVLDKLLISNARSIRDAANHAEQCYHAGVDDRPEGLGMFSCDLFVTPRLPSSSNTNEACPFKKEICRNESSNLLLDTGYIDSQLHLGINSPPKQRFLFREVTQCAPLQTGGYKQDISVSGSSETYTVYSYGRTIVISALQSYTTEGGIGNYSAFLPIPELQRTDADVGVVFLVREGMLYYHPSEDDWYRATILADGKFYSSLNETHQLYQPDEAASPMGCAHQCQFCQGAPPPEGECGPLGSWSDASDHAAFTLFARNSSRKDDFTKSDYMENRLPWILSIIQQSFYGIIKSQRHTPFSVFALGFTFALGLVIVILSYILDLILTCFDQRRQKTNPSRYRKDLEWVSADALHL